MRSARPGGAAVVAPVVCVGAMTLAMAAGTTEPAGMFGFSAADGAREAALEQRFDAVLDPAELRGWLKTLSAEPNNGGAPHDKANAELVRDLIRQWGWDAHIEVFEVLYPTLKHHSLELLAPTHFTASLTEPPVEGDATSTRTDGLPPYNEYGADAMSPASSCMSTTGCQRTTARSRGVGSTSGERSRSLAMARAGED